MQNASCGVRTLIACQLRFSTSTIVLFSMSDISLNGVMEFWRIGVLLTPSLHYSNTPCVPAVFVLCCSASLNSLNHQLSTSANWLPRLVLLQGACAWPPSGVRDRRTPDYATRQWSPGRELHPQHLFVGET